MSDTTPMTDSEERIWMLAAIDAVNVHDIERMPQAEQFVQWMADRRLELFRAVERARRERNK